MRKLYRSSPCYLPLFSLITDWARSCGVIRSASLQANSGCSSGDASEKVLMKSGFLHALILHILTRTEKDEGDRDGDGDEGELEQEGGEKDIEAIVRDDSPIDTSFNALPVPDPLSPSSPLHLHLDDDCIVPGCDTFNYLSNSADSDPSILARLLTKFFKGGAGLEGDFCYTWPIPGKPTHVLDAYTIGEFATYCARTYQMMAYSGSWAVILDRCSDNDEVSFSVRLPDGISSAMMRCYESQALRLKAISNVRHTLLSPLHPIRLSKTLSPLLSSLFLSFLFTFFESLHCICSTVFYSHLVFSSRLISPPLMSSSLNLTPLLSGLFSSLSSSFFSSLFSHFISHFSLLLT